MSNITSNIQVGEKRPHRDGLDSHEQKLMQRILLELYCQYEPSLHFREVIPPDNLEYHEKIKRPMSFDMIRKRLASTSSDHYQSIREVVDDIRLVFKNAYTFNPKESQVYSDAKSLEEFLDMLLEKWIPSLAYDDTDMDLPSAPKRLKRGRDE